MKQKVLVTLFVFAICLAVLGIFHSRPVATDSRFKGVAFSQDKEIEDNITLRLTGDLKEYLFKNSSFTGKLTITAKDKEETFDDLTFSFNKKGTSNCTLTFYNEETSTEETFGTLAVSKDFEMIGIHITWNDFLGEEVYVAAPATNLKQAQSITNDVF